MPTTRARVRHHVPVPGIDARERVALAARDNAWWCHAFARSHAVVGVLADDAWTSPARTPAGYPDAVTLRPGADAAAVLSRVDDRASGCSVKDSWADLDLSPYGFRVLFDASWTWRAPGGGPTTPGRGRRWSRVSAAGPLRTWERARGGPGAEPRLRPELLRVPGIDVLAAWEGPEVVAGGILTQGVPEVVGVSNVFTVHGDPAATWAGVTSWASHRYPGLPLVGYESALDLDHALAAGFVVTGPLRVWLATA